MDGELVGFSLIAVSVLMWSIAPALASRASAKRGESFDSKSFNAWRVFFSLLATSPLAFLYGFPFNVPWLDIVFEVGVIIGGVLSTVLGDTLFVYTVSRLGASLAIPLAYLFVIWSALVDYQLGRTSIHVLLAAFIAIAGIWLSFSGSGKRDKKGFAAGLATSLIWAASIYGYDYALAVLQENTALDPLAASIVIGEVRSIYSLLVMIPFLSLTKVRGVVGEALLSSLAGYVIGAYAFIASLAFLAPSIVSIGLALTPLVTQFAANRVAAETLNLRLVGGAALVTFSLILTAMPTG